jgi:hypothetical protein
VAFHDLNGAVRGTNLYILGDTYAFNPKTVMDVRAEWVRFRFSKIARVNNFNLGKLGGGSVTGTNNCAPLRQYNPTGAQYLPGPTFSSSVGSLAHNLLPNTGLGAPVFTSAVAGTFGTTGSGQQWDNYGLNGTLTRVFGKHSMKFGVEARLMDMEVLPSGNPANPSFGVNYSCTYTGSTCNAGTGDEWAELLEGYFVQTTFGATYGGTEFNWYQAYFASDNWQVSPKLTLNLGLRCELPGSLYEKKNHALVFQPFTTDPVTGAYGTEALVASPQSPTRATTATKYLDFDPRIGFAYRLDSKTVVRGGFGVTQMAVDLDGGGNGAPGSSLNGATLGWKNTTGTGTLPSTTLQYPITASAVFVPPQFHTNRAFVQTLAQANQTSGGIGLAGNYINERLPYFEQYNFAIQRQFGNAFQTTVAYVGSHGLELNAGGSIDEILPSQYTVTGNAATGETATSAVTAPGVAVGANLTAAVTSTVTTIYTPNGNGANVVSTGQKGVLCTPGYVAPTGNASFTGFCNANVKVGGALQPYPNYTGATISNLAYGNQHYNGLQVTTTWRIPGGGLIGSALTFAKTIGDNVNYQDYNNHRGDRTVQGVPSRFVVNFNYPLPIGHGQKFFNVGNPVASAIISGWAINDVSSFQHGGYLGITSNTKTSINGAGTTRATYVPGCNKVISGAAVARLNQWFNTACFAGVNQKVNGTAIMGAYDWGNENAQDPKLFAQGIDNSDISLAKTTKVAEKFSVIFRMDTFNTFNRFEAAAPTSLAAGNALFGVVQAQANNPRQVQLSLRVTY